MKLLMIIVAFATMLGGHIYALYRVWQMMPPSLIGRILIITIPIISFFSMILSIIAGEQFPSSITSIMYKVGTSWLIIFLYLLIIILLLDLIRATHLLPIDPFMRNSWIGFGVLALGLILLFSVGNYRYHHKKRVELNLTVEKPLKDNKPIKIVAISDLHLGYGIGKKEFQKWIELINKENPDIVLIAGDAIDNNIFPLLEQNMKEVFRQIRVKHGIYVIPGNHEYIAGIDKAIAFFENSGVVFLQDSAILVDDNFYIIGRDDRMNPKRKSTKELTAELDNTKPLILLDHQPLHLDETEESRIDLQFSGHTHGGQVWPISYITGIMFEKDHGYIQKGNSHIYVSSGLGIWGGKFRIGTQSEYVVITLGNKP